MKLGFSLAYPIKLVAAALATVSFLALGSPRAVAQSVASLHLAMGNPTGATTSLATPTNYLMSKAQYALSYNNSTRIPNWVSWHLGSPDFGSAPRSTSFTTDTTLPSGWYRVTSSDYTNSGFDRGHNCPSADRTWSIADNKATFLMTNIIPQEPDNNQGPWADLEDYCRDLVNAGNELYVVSSWDTVKGTIAGGKVTVPKWLHKVIVVLPEASGNDVARVTTGARVIAVSMPNDPGIRFVDWKTYRVSVDQVEFYTGDDYLSNVPASVQSVVESRVDSL